MPVSSLAPDDFAWLPATEQLAALDAKDVSSAELVELYLSRISAHNPSLNAIVTVDPDAARRAATEADAARSRGDDLGPLHGLPITVKDSYETAGMRTVCGPAAERGGWRQWPRRTRRWTKTAPSSAHGDQPHRKPQTGATGASNNAATKTMITAMSLCRPRDGNHAGRQHLSPTVGTTRRSA